MMTIHTAVGAVLVGILLGILLGPPGVEGAPPPVDEAAIKAFIDKIRNTPVSSRVTAPTDLANLLPLLEQGRLLVVSVAGTQVFRENDDVGVVSKLAKFATFEDRGIRINATLILANVVDNTTLCGVLDTLVDRDINENARFNLLQVVKAVSTYAFEENKRWTLAVHGEMRKFLTNKGDVEKTLQLMAQIETNLTTVNPKVAEVKLQDRFKSQFEACSKLPNINALDLSRGRPREDARARTSVTVPFAVFTPKVEIDKDEFKVQGSFSLDAPSDGIPPGLKDMTLELTGGTGTFSTTIPAGSFTQEREGRFKYEGKINGVELKANITSLGGNTFKFEVDGEHANLTEIKNPVTVKLTIDSDNRNYSGDAQVTAKFE